MRCSEINNEIPFLQHIFASKTGLRAGFFVVLKANKLMMHLIHLNDCEPFYAGDNTWLREILHPDKAPLNLRYSLAHAVVKAGLTSFLHRLKTSEVYYILQGEGLMQIENEQQVVGPGHTIYIPPNAKQCITNTGTEDLVFLCIVDPAWRVEDEIILEQEKK